MNIKNTKAALKIISDASYEQIFKNGRKTKSKIFPENSRSLLIINKTFEALESHADLLEEDDIQEIDNAIIEFTNTKPTHHIKEKLTNIYSFNIFDNIEDIALSTAKSKLGKNLKRVIKPFLIAEKIITKEMIESINQHSTKVLDESLKTLELLDDIKLRAIDSESIISNNKSLFSNFLNRQESEFQNVISGKNNEINKIISSVEEKLIAIEKDHEKRTNAYLENLKEEINNQTNDLKNIAKDELEPTKKEATQILADVINLKNKTQELIGEISSGASAKHYEDAYKGEMRTRLIWQALSIFGFIAIAIILQKTAFQLLNLNSKELTSYDIFSFSIRATSIFMAVFFITYCSKQANKHHELEKFNRQMRFELLTLDNYLSTLSDQGQRESTKIQLKENFFGQSHKLMSDLAKPEHTQTVTAEIKGILDSLIKVIEIKKSN